MFTISNLYLTHCRCKINKANYNSGDLANRQIAAVPSYFERVEKMKDKHYRIGEVSKITGISKDTLHFYNKIGLLVPEYTNPENGYGYYSHRNLWQLDIISTCRKLSIPLETVKQILSLKDNREIVKLLMAYRDEAIRLSAYYQQVAEDIVWYREENEHIVEAQGNDIEISEQYLDREIVIAGDLGKNDFSYHANLQNATKNEIRYAPSIRRKYGYVLNSLKLSDGIVKKERGYLKLDMSDYEHIPKENLLEIPKGKYAVCTLKVENETVDFTPVLDWIKEKGYQLGAVYAEEIGLQLFPYMDSYYCEFKIAIF